MILMWGGCYPFHSYQLGVGVVAAYHAHPACQIAQSIEARDRLSGQGPSWPACRYCLSEAALAGAWPKEVLAAASQLSRRKSARRQRVGERRLLLRKTRLLILNVYSSRLLPGALAALRSTGARAEGGVVY
jgi:hypothetical protein